MTASASMQTMHYSVAGLGPRLPSARTQYSAVLPLSRRAAGSGGMRVRCQAEEQPPPTPTPTPKTPSTTSPSPLPPSPKRESTRFSDVLAFSGPGPERINGRLAMVGFVSAVAVEVARGVGLFDQIADGGVSWFVAAAAVLSAASLVPLFKGVSAQSRSGGLMTADAELWNGRFAMMGLVALAFTEYVKGGPLV